MDRKPDKSLLEVRKDIDETRCSMAQTLGEIRQEVEEGLDWRSYIRCYPAAALAAAGGVVWIVGRRLRGRRQGSLSESDKALKSSEAYPHSSSAVSRMADRVASLIAGQIMAVLAVHLRDFLLSPPGNPDSRS